MTITQSFIDGESVASAQLYDNIDPATGRSLGPVARSGADEVGRAAATARPTSSAPARATGPKDRPVAGSMLSYSSADTTDSPSMNDCVMVTVTPDCLASYQRLSIRYCIFLSIVWAVGRPVT